MRATTERLLNDLGLVACADTRVGDGKTRGISGGEKKRLALGVQLVGAPSVIFADEPTSGLDSFQAERVMKTLSKLAREGGKTIVCSIHQPRSSIVDLFDDLYLLAGGRCAYFGPIEGQEQRREPLPRRGQKLPEGARVEQLHLARGAPLDELKSDELSTRGLSAEG